MTRQLSANVTSVIMRVLLRNATNGPVTGIVFNSGITVTLTPDNLEPSTLSAQVLAAIGVYQAPTSLSAVRFGEVDNVRTPGLYELHFHNGLFTAVNLGVTRFLDLVVKSNSGTAFMPHWEVIQIAASGGGDATLAKQNEILAAINNISTDGGITYVNPVNPVTQELRIVRGDDYFAADGRALEWSSSIWPDLTGASIDFTIENKTTGVKTLTTTGVVVTPTAPALVRVELESVGTALLEPVKNVYSYDVQATLAGDSHKITLVIGNVTVVRDYTET